MTVADTAQAPDGIAVIGMAGRFPGADGLEAYWRNLREGRTSVTRFTDAELRAAGVPPELLADPRYVKAAPVLEGVESFAAEFFDCSRREATLMDPQQRIFLECAWEAMEAAGYPRGACPASVGVYAGAGGAVSSYLLAYAASHPELVGPTGSLQHLGNDKDYLATRVSFKLDLRGPSVTVQTACSTSLVAVHLACQSLLAGECDMALAGGVSIRVPHRVGYLYEEGGIVSPDGVCRPFDARAQGTVFGSGAGVVLLKPLAEALADGDPVTAVIRGSAINNDGGAKLSYTASDAEGQARAVAEALGVAGVDPATVSYVEAHGTATAMGDPVEIAALTRVFRRATEATGFCAVGSVKGNLGHLESAAGIAGLIKVVLAMRAGELPPSLHCEEPNPKIAFGDGPFTVQRELAPWRRGEHPRRACVNCLGLGGTNAFVVLEEAPAPKAARAEPERPLHLLALSAGSETALAALADRYRQTLGTPGAPPLADACFTAGAGRAHFAHRLALPAATADEAAAGLSAFLRGEDEGVRRGRRRASGRPRIAFLFTGQGSQRPGMGRELFATQPTFRRALARCDEILRDELERPLLEVVHAEPGSAAAALLDDTAYTQPALVALEASLCELWRSWGIEPDVVLGHSIGEVTAAWAAGALELEPALRLAAARGRLMASLPRLGAMAAVRAPEERVREVVAARGSAAEVAVAAVNGPRDVVLSGRREAVEALLEDLAADGVRTRRLTVSHAFHSPLMDPVLDAFEEEAGRLQVAPPRIPLVSNVTGRPASQEELAGAEYWRRHAREPVRFAAGLAALAAEGVEVFLEVGPHPTLTTLARRNPAGEAGTWLASLRRDRDDHRVLLDSLGALYAAGMEVDWAGFDRDYPRRRVALPTYPFERQRYWIDGAAETPGSGGEPLYRVEWRPAERGAGAAPAGEGEWLILADAGGTGEELARRLGARGRTAHLAFARRPGAAPRPGTTEVDPEDPEAMAALVAGRSLRGVVYLWGLDAPTDPEAPAARVAAAGERLLAGALHLFQALAQGGGPGTTRVWMVTRGACAVDGGGLPGVAAAPLWGLGRVAALEHPELWGGLVDLDPAGGAGGAEALADELEAAGPADQVALRGGDRRVPHLVPVEAPEEGLPLSPEATYLVTGGLGALGRQVALSLAERGARHLALVGRRPPGPEARERIARMEEAGARVRVLSADLAVAADAERVLAEIDASMPPLKGIVHAAGVLDDGVLLSQSRERFSRVLAPKLRGAWHLHALTRERELDFFVLFSSMSALLGWPGQGGYAAANAFLDALAEHRRGLGLPACSVAWGPWRGDGMAAELPERDRRRFQQAGVEPLEAGDALEVLGRLTAAGPAVAAVAAVMRVDWDAHRRWRPAAGGVLVSGPAPQASTPSGPAAARTPKLAALLAEALPGEERGVILECVRGEVARALGLTGPGEVDLATGLFDLGMDSLVAVEFRNRLQRTVGDGVTLPQTLVLDHPTTGDVAALLARELLALPQARKGGPEAGAEEEAEGPGLALELTEEELAGLSEVEAERLLLDRLTALEERIPQ